MDILQGVPGRAPAVCAGAVLLLAINAARGQDALVVDGVFDDWGGITPIAADPAGDATGAFDLTAVSVTSRGKTLYLRFDTGRELNLQSGPKGDGTLRLIVSAGTRKAVVDMRKRTYRIESGSPASGWAALDYVSAPTHSAREFEVALDLTGLGVGPGDEVRIEFDGSDELAAPIGWRLSSPAPEPAVRSPQRGPDTDVRIVSLNTRRTGLHDAARRPALLRLVLGPDPDVITFQEEYDSSAEEIARLLTESDPTRRAWFAHKEGDCVIAARRPLLPTPPGTGRRVYAAAAVPRDEGPALLVLSIHPKCCGHIGSREDRRRIEQTREMIAAIKRLREGDAKAPVVVIGDWNLVGSRRPLDLFRDEVGLVDVRLADLHDARIVTWLDAESPFAPGRLDLAVYDPRSLTVRNAFVVDTERLPAPALTGLRLEPSDSRATDHLLLVVDFDLPES